MERAKRVSGHAFRMPDDEMVEFGSVVAARGYEVAQALRVLVRRVNRGVIELPPVTTEHAIREQTPEPAA